MTQDVEARIAEIHWLAAAKGVAMVHFPHEKVMRLSEAITALERRLEEAGKVIAPLAYGIASLDRLHTDLGCLLKNEHAPVTVSSVSGEPFELFKIRDLRAAKAFLSTAKEQEDDDAGK